MPSDMGDTDKSNFSSHRCPQCSKVFPKQPWLIHHMASCLPSHLTSSEGSDELGDLSAQAHPPASSLPSHLTSSEGRSELGDLPSPQPSMPSCLPSHLNSSESRPELGDIPSPQPSMSSCLPRHLTSSEGKTELGDLPAQARPMATYLPSHPTSSEGRTELGDLAASAHPMASCLPGHLTSSEGRTELGDLPAQQPSMSPCLSSHMSSSEGRTELGDLPALAHPTASCLPNHLISSESSAKLEKDIPAAVPAEIPYSQCDERNCQRDSKEETSYKCPICATSFSMHFLLKQHMVLMHRTPLHLQSLNSVLSSSSTANLAVWSQTTSSRNPCKTRVRKSSSSPKSKAFSASCPFCYTSNHKYASLWHLQKHMSSKHPKGKSHLRRLSEHPYKTQSSVKENQTSITRIFDDPLEKGLTNDSENTYNRTHEISDDSFNQCSDREDITNSRTLSSDSKIEENQSQPLKCPLCPDELVFSDVHALSVHTLGKHSPDLRLPKCALNSAPDICPATQNLEDNNSKSTKYQGSPLKLYLFKCHKCSINGIEKFFKSYEGFTNHIKKNHDEASSVQSTNNPGRISPEELKLSQSTFIQQVKSFHVQVSMNDKAAPGHSTSDNTTMDIELDSDSDESLPEIDLTPTKKRKTILDIDNIQMNIERDSPLPSSEVSSLKEMDEIDLTPTKKPNTTQDHKNIQINIESDSPLLSSEVPSKEMDSVSCEVEHEVDEKCGSRIEEVVESSRDEENCFADSKDQEEMDSVVCEVELEHKVDEKRGSRVGELVESSIDEENGFADSKDQEEMDSVVCEVELEHKVDEKRGNRIGELVESSIDEENGFADSKDQEADIDVKDYIDCIDGSVKDKMSSNNYRTALTVLPTDIIAPHSGRAPSMETGVDTIKISEGAKTPAVCEMIMETRDDSQLSATCVSSEREASTTIDHRRIDDDPILAQVVDYDVDIDYKMIERPKTSVVCKNKMETNHDSEQPVTCVSSDCETRAVIDEDSLITRMEDYDTGVMTSDDPMPAQMADCLMTNDDDPMLTDDDDPMLTEMADLIENKLGVANAKETDIVCIQDGTEKMENDAWCVENGLEVMCQTVEEDTEMTDDDDLMLAEMADVIEKKLDEANTNESDTGCVQDAAKMIDNGLFCVEDGADETSVIGFVEDAVLDERDGTMVAKRDVGHVGVSTEVMGNSCVKDYPGMTEKDTAYVKDSTERANNDAARGNDVAEMMERDFAHVEVSTEIMSDAACVENDTEMVKSNIYLVGDCLKMLKREIDHVQDSTQMIKDTACIKKDAEGKRDGPMLVQGNIGHVEKNTEMTNHTACIKEEIVGSDTAFVEDSPFTKMKSNTSFENDAEMSKGDDQSETTLGHLNSTLASKDSTVSSTDCSKNLSHNQSEKASYSNTRNLVSDDDCHYTFSESSLKDQIIMIQESPSSSGFKCKLCHKRFGKDTLPLIHMRSHFERQNYHCSFCPFRSSFKSSMLKHIKSNHNINQPRGVKRKFDFLNQEIRKDPNTPTRSKVIAPELSPSASAKKWCHEEKTLLKSLSSEVEFSKFTPLVVRKIKSNRRKASAPRRADFIAEDSDASTTEDQTISTRDNTRALQIEDSDDLTAQNQTTSIRDDPEDDNCGDSNSNLVINYAESLTETDMTPPHMPPQDQQLENSDTDSAPEVSNSKEMNNDVMPIQTPSGQQLDGYDCILELGDLTLRYLKQLQNIPPRTNISCGICNTTMEGRQAAFEHANSHTSEQPYRCKHCKGYRRTLLQMKYHLVVLHRIYDPNLPPWHGNLLEDLVVQQMDDSRSEDQGGITMSTTQQPAVINPPAANPLIHHNQEEGIKGFQTNHCALILSHDLYNALIKLSQKSLPRRCQEIPCVKAGKKMMFHSLQSLFQHILSHTSQSPYICGHCDYKTKKLSVLNNHMKTTHSGFLTDQWSIPPVDHLIRYFEPTQVMDNNRNGHSSVTSASNPQVQSSSAVKDNIESHPYGLMTTANHQVPSELAKPPTASLSTQSQIASLSLSEPTTPSLQHQVAPATPTEQAHVPCVMTTSVVQDQVPPTMASSHKSIPSAISTDASNQMTPALASLSELPQTPYVSAYSAMLRFKSQIQSRAEQSQVHTTSRSSILMPQGETSVQNQTSPTLASPSELSRPPYLMASSTIPHQMVLKTLLPPSQVQSTAEQSQILATSTTSAHQMTPTVTSQPESSITSYAIPHQMTSRDLPLPSQVQSCAEISQALRTSTTSAHQGARFVQNQMTATHQPEPSITSYAIPHQMTSRALPLLSQVQSCAEQSQAQRSDLHSSVSAQRSDLHSSVMNDKEGSTSNGHDSESTASVDSVIKRDRHLQKYIMEVSFIYSPSKAEKRLMTAIDGNKATFLPCPRCTKVFKLDDIVVHLRIAHEKSKPYSCCYCSFKCNVYGQIAKHLQTSHFEEESVTKNFHICNARNRQYHEVYFKASDSALRGTQVYHCNACNFTSHMINSMRKHVVSFHKFMLGLEKDPHTWLAYRCLRCKETLDFALEMPFQHKCKIPRNTQERYRDETSLAHCRFCVFTTDVKAVMKVHLLVVHNWDIDRQQTQMVDDAGFQNGQPVKDATSEQLIREMTSTGAPRSSSNIKQNQHLAQVRKDGELLSTGVLPKPRHCSNIEQNQHLAQVRTDGELISTGLLPKPRHCSNIEQNQHLAQVRKDGELISTGLLPKPRHCSNIEQNQHLAQVRNDGELISSGLLPKPRSASNIEQNQHLTQVRKDSQESNLPHVPSMTLQQRLDAPMIWTKDWTLPSQQHTSRIPRLQQPSCCMAQSIMSMAPSGQSSATHLTNNPALQRPPLPSTRFIHRYDNFMRQDPIMLPPSDELQRFAEPRPTGGRLQSCSVLSNPVPAPTVRHPRFISSYNPTVRIGPSNQQIPHPSNHWQHMTPLRLPLPRPDMAHPSYQTYQHLYQDISPVSTTALPPPSYASHMITDLLDKSTSLQKHQNSECPNLEHEKSQTTQQNFVSSDLAHPQSAEGTVSTSLTSELSNALREPSDSTLARSAPGTMISNLGSELNNAPREPSDLTHPQSTPGTMISNLGSELSNAPREPSDSALAQSALGTVTISLSSELSNATREPSDLTHPTSAQGTVTATLSSELSNAPREPIDSTLARNALGTVTFNLGSELSDAPGEPSDLAHPQSVEGNVTPTLSSELSNAPRESSDLTRLPSSQGTMAMGSFSELSNTPTISSASPQLQGSQDITVTSPVMELINAPQECTVLGHPRESLTSPRTMTENHSNNENDIEISNNENSASGNNGNGHVDNLEDDGFLDWMLNSPSADVPKSSLSQELNLDQAFELNETEECCSSTIAESSTDLESNPDCLVIADDTETFNSSTVTDSSTDVESDPDCLVIDELSEAEACNSSTVTEFSTDLESESDCEMIDDKEACDANVSAANSFDKSPPQLSLSAIPSELNVEQDCHLGSMPTLTLESAFEQDCQVIEDESDHGSVSTESPTKSVPESKETSPIAPRVKTVNKSLMKKSGFGRPC